MALCLPLSMLHAQTVKKITVSQSDSYTDHVALGSDERDMDIMVKFVFNEEKNTLTVSLISYRQLFVFWNNTRYKDAVRCRRIHPDKLPYVVSYNPKDRFKLSSKYCRMLTTPRRRHVFKKWYDVTGLQPVESEISMVNDFIEQTFDIKGKRNSITVRLRDVMLLDEVKKKASSSRYAISYGRNLNLEYRVTIERNPCFGLDEEAAAAQNSLVAIAKSYATLRKTAGKVAGEEGAKLFADMKATLVEQYPKNNVASPCPDIQKSRDIYNHLVDSINLLDVQVEDGVVVRGGVVAEGSSLNAKEILSQARLLDRTVSRWLASKDATERSDLQKQGRDIIKDVNVMIAGRRGYSQDERRAIEVFRKAEKYFNKVCK